MLLDDFVIAVNGTMEIQESISALSLVFPRAGEESQRGSLNLHRQVLLIRQNSIIRFQFVFLQESFSVGDLHVELRKIQCDK